MPVQVGDERPRRPCSARSARRTSGARGERSAPAGGRSARRPRRRAPAAPPPRRARSGRTRRAGRRCAPWSSPRISSGKLKSSPVYRRTPSGSRRRSATSRPASSRETLIPSIAPAVVGDQALPPTSRRRPGPRSPSSPRAPGSKTSPEPMQDHGARAPARARRRRRPDSRPARSPQPRGARLAMTTTVAPSASISSHCST